ncbi:MAG: hypothetical protein A4E38_01223 [Methanoregulaceae archaeon PtaB.Bin108]|nr:MAG: hypothetical protein A4E38_01223 [Methanoregulaceae archaeon PtaB.Bin108]OPY46796.1 MAG: hypothetical protein A4E42_00403 [Methanoregulaceae archaeon PtaU1.Bin222]
MDSVQLKIQERAFPSRGRARLNEVYLKQLGISEGDEVDLFKDPSAKPVAVTVFADTLVEEGHIRLSTEDIASIGVAPGTTITVKKRPPLADRVKKGAKDSAESVRAGAKGAAETIRGKAKGAEKDLQESASTAKETLEKSSEALKKKLSEKDL